MGNGCHIASVSHLYGADSSDSEESLIHKYQRTAEMIHRSDGNYRICPNCNEEVKVGTECHICGWRCHEYKPERYVEKT